MGLVLGGEEDIKLSTISVTRLIVYIACESTEMAIHR